MRVVVLYAIHYHLQLENELKFLLDVNWNKIVTCLVLSFRTFLTSLRTAGTSGPFSTQEPSEMTRGQTSKFFSFISVPVVPALIERS